MKKTSDGIEVFTRSSELSDLDEFKGIGNINAPLEQIIKVFQNADQMSYWSPNCEESRLMERQGNVQIHYTISGAPFPIQDRDAFTQFKYIPQDNGMKIEISAIPQYGPENEDYVRIQYATGFWMLEKISENKTKVTYQLQADPGGSIPGWLANTGSVDTPLNTIKSLRLRTRSQKYIFKYLFKFCTRSLHSN